MRKLFDAEGLFYKYRKNEVKIREGYSLLHEVEEPTELWWKLKESIKGKRVKIVAYEVEE